MPMSFVSGHLLNKGIIEFRQKNGSPLDLGMPLFNYLGAEKAGTLYGVPAATKPDDKKVDQIGFFVVSPEGRSIRFFASPANSVLFLKSSIKQRLGVPMGPAAGGSQTRTRVCRQPAARVAPCSCEQGSQPVRSHQVKMLVRGGGNRPSPPEGHAV